MADEKIKIKPSEARIRVGGLVTLVAVVTRNEVELEPSELQSFTFEWTLSPGNISLNPEINTPHIVVWATESKIPGVYAITVKLKSSGTVLASDTCSITVTDMLIDIVSMPPIDIVTKRYQTDAQSLNVAIRARTDAIGFDKYLDFLDIIIGGTKDINTKAQAALSAASKKAAALKDFPEIFKKNCQDIENYLFKGVYGYGLLKIATQIFLILKNCSLKIDDEFNENNEERRLGRKVSLEVIKEELVTYLGGNENRLPYFDQILENLSLSGYLDELYSRKNSPLRSRVECPCMVELIWSYWHEEGMLVQAMNAISLRFQNKLNPAIRNPLANLTVDPLRPLGNLLWGYVQDEQHRLTLQRRAYEYDHEYGLTLVGKAVPALQSVDSRSKFLEAFHNLLNSCMNFYKEENNKMVIPDAFPLLNALKEVHLILAEGAHNQFGDLPWTARAEMLMQQWLLARPEMREFLSRRPMMPYTEAWMAPVDAMKSLQGWTDVSVIHFRDLGAFGEQIFLSIRYGNWNDVNDAEEARNWALYWRNEIQSYVHAYRSVTGVDLANPVTKGKIDYIKPSIHLNRRLELQLQGK